MDLLRNYENHVFDTFRDIFNEIMSTKSDHETDTIEVVKHENLLKFRYRRYLNFNKCSVVQTSII